MLQLYRMRRKQYHGQVLLITVLVLTIAITVALSLIGRTTTDVGITGQQEESARAFSAAEAGIEEVLKNKTATTASIASGNANASFTTTYAEVAASSSVYTLPSTTKLGDAATVWLVQHNADGSLNESLTNAYCAGASPCELDVCWSGGSPTSAVDISVLVKSGATYQIHRTPIHPDAATYANNFGAPDTGTGCGMTSGYHKKITIPTTGGVIPLIVRLRPYYRENTFLVAPVSGKVLPPQGFEVSSTGKTESGITRKIVVKHQFEAPPSVFDYVLYSEGTIQYAL